MAIIKFNNRKNSTVNCNSNKLRRGIQYITNHKKTSKDLVGGIGVNCENAYERMQFVKHFYGKEGGREYIHFAVSFKGKKDVDTAYFIAQNIADLYEDFQVLFAVHINTANTHIHFIINSVNVKDGHKFSQSKSDLQRLKDKINLIADKYGLNAEEITVDEDDYFDFEDDAEYEFDKQNLIEPMIFYDIEGSIKPLIPNYEYKEDSEQN